MTVLTTATKVIGLGNGATTVWPFGFFIPGASPTDASQMNVWFVDVNGAITLLSPASYTVAGAGVPGGGSVTYPLAGPPITVGQKLVIARNVPYTQPNSTINAGNMFPTVIEGSDDNQEYQLQQINERISASLQLPITSDQSVVSPVLPTPVAGSVLGWDPTATKIINYIMATAGIIGPIAVGQIAFGAAGNTLAQDANLFWDNTNKRLGVGNAAPTQTLDVTGTGKFSTSVVTTSVLSGGVANINVGGGGGNWVFDGASGSLYPGSGLSGLVDIGKASTNLVRSGFFGTSVVTPQVTSAGQLNLAANNTVAWIILGGGNAALAPGADNILKLGDPTLRIATAFATAIDSGTPGSLSLRTNNGTVGLQVVDVAGGVNFLQAVSGTTGNAPGIQAGGANTDIGINYIGKGNSSHVFYSDSGSNAQFVILRTTGATRSLSATGAVGPANPILGATAGGVAIVGTPTNDNAASGQYGEYSSVTVGSGSAVALTTVTPANVTSITLGAGDWDVTGTIAWQFGATTSYTNLLADWSTTTGTLSGIVGQRFDYETPATVPTAGSDMQFTMPTTRFSLPGSTTIFLVAQGTFTISTLKAYGFIRARRVR